MEDELTRCDKALGHTPHEPYGINTTTTRLFWVCRFGSVVTGYNGPMPTRTISALTIFSFNIPATVSARLFANALLPGVRPRTLPEWPVTKIILAWRTRDRP